MYALLPVSRQRINTPERIKSSAGSAPRLRQKLSPPAAATSKNVSTVKRVLFHSTWHRKRHRNQSVKGDGDEPETAHFTKRPAQGGKAAVAGNGRSADKSSSKES